MSNIFNSTSFPGLSYCLVSGEVKPVKEGETARAPRTSLCFQVDNWIVPVKVNKVEHKLPVTFSKKAVENIVKASTLFEKSVIVKDVEGNEEIKDIPCTIEDMPYKSLSKAAAAEVPGLESFLNSVPEMKEEPLRVFFLAAMQVVKDNEKTSDSMANPDRAVRNHFLNLDTWEVLRNSVIDPAMAVQEDYRRQIRELKTLILKAAEVSREEYFAHAEKYVSANGVDDEGFVRLKAKKGSVAKA